MAAVTETGIHKPSSHRALSRKALIGVLLVVGVAAIIVAVPTVVVAASPSPPWWVTVIGGVAGGIVGTVATGGTPIGAIAGATMGAALANYIYGISSKQSNLPSGLTALQTEQYTGSVSNATLDQLLMENSTAITMHDLTQTSYYYFAQAMEAVVPYFLPNSSLNASYVGWDSGIYADMSNISASVINPLNRISFLMFEWAIQNSYPTSSATTYANLEPFVYGNAMSNGSEFFLTPNSNLYAVGNTTIVLRNVVTGNYYDVNISLSQATDTTAVWNDAWQYKTNTVSVPNIYQVRQFGIPVGVYKVINATTLVTPIVNYLYTTTTYSHNVAAIYTDAIQLSSNGQVSNNYAVGEYTLTPSDVGPPYSNIIASENVNGNGYFWAIPTGQYVAASHTSLNVLGGITSLLAGITTSFTDAYNSADAYFNQLKSLGYNSPSQVPASLLQTFPSTYVPASMLNGTFNASELQALYIAYLLQLKSWLNETSTHTLKGNMSVSNSTFDNGFVQVYGNLEQNVTSAGVTTHNYYNNTWFVPLINLGHWPFRDKTWTNITNNSPDPDFLIVSGTDSGTLLNVYNGSFYTEAITVNGTSVSSYTISPVTISYVLPQTVQIGKLSNTGGFFTNRYGPLATWEWILIGLISLVAVAAIFERRD